MSRSTPGHYAAAALALALLAALVVLLVATRHPGQSRPAPAALAAERLFAITLEDADGHAQALSQWRGKHLVVNFWATWCAPCVAEMPELDRLQRQYARHDVSVIGIGIDTADRVQRFRDRLGLQMTLLVGGYDALSLARAFGDDQGVLPYTALLSTDGRIVRRRVGALRPGELQEWLSSTH